MKKVLLKIGGMSCAACSGSLEKYLNKQDGIISATINLVMNNANIEYDDKKLTLEDIERFVKKAGFESLGIDNFKDEKKNERKEKIEFSILTVTSIFVFYISMAQMLGFPTIPFFNMNTNPNNYSVSLFVLTTIVLLLERKTIIRGIKNLIHLIPNMDSLVTIGVISSYIYSIFGMIMILEEDISYIHKLYFESSVMVLFFIKIGKLIESKNKDKTKEAIKSLMLVTPLNATKVIGEKEIVVPIDEIQKGDILIAKAGDKIAVDGTVVEGISHVDESFITGESMPVKKEEGLRVIAGSINFEGILKYKAEKVGKESSISEIVRLVTNATSTKMPISKLVDKISEKFVPTILLLAIFSFIIWVATSKDLYIALNAFVSVLVVACPCALGLATPLAIVIVTGEATKLGILIKNGEVLENAHKVKNVVFDKTGTLTMGKISISDLILYDKKLKSDKKTIEKEFFVLKKIEEKSNHPLAHAVCNYLNNEKIEVKIKENANETKEVIEIKEEKINIRDYITIGGCGIKALVDKDAYFVGNKRLMEDNNIKLSKKMLCDIDKSSRMGSIILVAKNEKVLMLLETSDLIREDSRQVINNLKEKNINVVMLTGDNENSAKEVARKLNIDKVIAGADPKEKAKQIENLKKDGIVMMCGDGVNDSIGLVASDISVSVYNGTDIASNSSTVTLMSDNLYRIIDLIDISKKTIKNIKQNLFWAFFYNVCMIPIAAGAFNGLNITISPMIAGVAMTLSSLTVVINALRLKNISKTINDKE